jgi:hypothetical protein
MLGSGANLEQHHQFGSESTGLEKMTGAARDIDLQILTDLAGTDSPEPYPSRRVLVNH